MSDRICTFCGHRDTPDDRVNVQVDEEADHWACDRDDCCSERIAELTGDMSEPCGDDDAV